MSFGHLLAVVVREPGGARRDNVGNDSPPAIIAGSSACGKHRQTGSTTAPGPTRRRSRCSADGESLDYAALRAEAGAVAAALADAGVGIGDPVAIDLPAGVPHAVALHGAILAGAVVQSLPPTGREGVDVARATTYLDGAWVERARARHEAWPSFSRHPALPLTRTLSSGTSGTPKPVVLTAGNHLWSALRQRTQPRGRARRPLALLPAAQPRRRADDPDPLGRSTAPAP